MNAIRMKIYYLPFVSPYESRNFVIIIHVINLNDRSQLMFFSLVGDYNMC